MRPTVSQYAAVLEELSSGADTKNISEIAKNFLGFLRRRGEADQAAAILDRLEKMEREKAGRLAVTVVTAHEVSEAAKRGNCFRGKRSISGTNAMRI
jgi:F0F1-type ATP synthase delta subunit